jgi:hypothetical protein
MINYLKLRKLAITLFLTFLSGLIYAQSFDGIDGLLARRFPFLKGKVVFQPLKGTLAMAGQDGYRMYSRAGKLVVEASSVSAAATGLNQYLKEYCFLSLSRGGDNTKLIGLLPQLKDTVSNSTPFKFRYALNYCTYSYTYSFYSWPDWEKELDWMALNGVNLMLAQLGTEEVWQHVLSKVGYSDREIKQFIPGPAYNAWWLMGNLEGWGGPVNDGQIKQWTQLQQKLLKRMGDLGITPVLQGFYGMVPANLKEKYPAAQIVAQGEWAGGFQRPGVLLPSDPLFKTMATAYYDKMKALYGADIHFFGGDLFHEGGNSTGLAIREIAHGVQTTMQNNFPGSTWVLQGWGSNPKKQLLEGLNPKSTLVIDLFGENGNNWEKTNEYGGFPWVWASVNNFGGKVGMGAQLPRLMSEPHRAFAKSRNGAMQGIGIIPEGIDNNPIVYDLALATAWLPQNAKIEDYLNGYLQARYGKGNNDDVSLAWLILLQSLYGNYKKSGEGGYESIFCARPALKIENVSTWGPKEMQYDPKLPLQALKLLRKGVNSYPGSETYKYDLTDLARQVLADHARPIFEKAMASFEQKDKTAFLKYSDQFLSMLKLQDKLLATHPKFMLGSWLNKARVFAEGDVYRKKVNEQNARMLITFWGPDNPETDLHDYANKEWSGMLKDFYLPRWERFFAELRGRLEGKAPVVINYFEMEKAWTLKNNSYPIRPVGNYLEVVDELINFINQK